MTKSKIAIINTLEKFTLDALNELKGTNIKILDVEGMTSIADRMILCTGRSTRHVKSIATNLISEAKKNNIDILGSEGLESSDWVLIDLGDIIIHVMQQETRDFYNLEALWGNVPVISQTSE